MRCTQHCPECPSRPDGPTPGKKHIVSGDWNNGLHNILFVGEAPGRMENSMSRVFVGTAGEEFNNTYLPLAGLSRSDVSMTNAVKCHWADTSDAPPSALVRSCAEFHLRKELAYHKPRYVVLMGGTANSLLGLDVEMEHGMVRQASLLGWSGTVFSTFHPALGLHKSDKMLAMVDRLDGDFPRLKRVLRGELHEIKDDLSTSFVRLRDAKSVRTVLRKGLGDGCDLAVDTESKKTWRGYKSTIRYTPWCATFAMWSGEAFMVRVDDAAFQAFADHINSFRRIIFHNAPYDHEILRMAGCNVDWARTHDTMSMAYDDARLPKGLKALSYRLLGKRMVSFDETVIPHSRDRAIDYMYAAMERDWPAAVQEHTGLMEWKNCPDCKGKGQFSIGRGKLKKTYECECHGGLRYVPRMTRKHSLNQKLNGLSTSIRKDPMGVNLWERWDGWIESDPASMDVLIQAMGAIPLPSIEYVPEHQAIEYACGDAHETLRIFPIIQQRLVEVRRRIKG